MGEGSVLHQKLQSHRPVSTGEGPARLWRTAFGRAARDIIGLPLTFDDPQDHRRSLAEVLEHLPERGLLMVLEGPKHEVGLVALSGDLASAILEQQTIGRVSKTAPPARRATRTDAAMSARLIDTALAHFGPALAASEETWAEGFVYASFLDEPRALGLLLEDVPYRMLSSTAFIGGTNRHCEFHLVLPHGVKKPVGLPEAAQHPDEATWRATLSATMMATPVTMTAVLTRLRLPLAQLKALISGDELSLPGARLDHIELLAPGDVLVAKARLGQTHGMRALKITESPTSAKESSEPSFHDISPPLLEAALPTLARSA